MDELFGLRDVLERYAVETALPLSGAHDMTALGEALEGMASAVRLDNPLGENEAHRRFHVALVALAGHRQLLMAYEPVILKLQLYMAANLRREAEQRAPSEGWSGTGGSSRPSPPATRPPCSTPCPGTERAPTSAERPATEKRTPGGAITLRSGSLTEA